MKNLFLSIFAITLSFGVFAQDTTTTKTVEPTMQQGPKKDVYALKEGKVWEFKNGQKSEVTTNVTLTNGSTLKTDGTVVTSDGQSTTLKEGQYVDVNGKIGDWKK